LFVKKEGKRAHQLERKEALLKDTSKVEARQKWLDSLKLTGDDSEEMKHLKLYFFPRNPREAPPSANDFLKQFSTRLVEEWNIEEWKKLLDFSRGKLGLGVFTAENVLHAVASGHSTSVEYVLQFSSPGWFKQGRFWCRNDFSDDECHVLLNLLKVLWSDGSSPKWFPEIAFYLRSSVFVQFYTSKGWCADVSKISLWDCYNLEAAKLLQLDFSNELLIYQAQNRSILLFLLENGARPNWKNLRKFLNIFRHDPACWILRCLLEFDVKMFEGFCASSVLDFVVKYEARFPFLDWHELISLLLEFNILIDTIWACAVVEQQISTYNSNDMSGRYHSLAAALFTARIVKKMPCSDPTCFLWRPWTHKHWRKHCQEKVLTMLLVLKRACPHLLRVLREKILILAMENVDVKGNVKDK
jgi:hypothetical protein